MAAFDFELDWGTNSSTLTRSECVRLATAAANPEFSHHSASGSKTRRGLRINAAARRYVLYEVHRLERTDTKPCDPRRLNARTNAGRKGGQLVRSPVQRNLHLQWRPSGNPHHPCIVSGWSQAIPPASRSLNC